MAHLLIFAILPAALVLGLVLLFAQRFRRALAGLLGLRSWLVVSVLLLAIYAAAVVLTACLPVAIDMAEVTIASVSYLSLHGAPMYTGSQDASRYSLLYGPMCFLPYAGALAAFGAGIGSLKLAMAMANLALFAVLWGVFRKLLTARETVVVLGLLAAALMMKQMPEFLMRGDVLLALAVALSLLAVGLRSRVGAVLLFGAACALGVDVKFTAAFYFLVPFYLFWRRHGRGAAAMAAVATPVLALLPFGLPAVSLRNYLVWVGEASHHPLAMKLFAMNVVTVAIMLAPSVTMGLRVYRGKILEAVRRHWPLVLCLGLSLAGSAITGSKVGAGRSHLNPSMIVCAYLAVLLWKKLPETERGAVWMRSDALVYALFLVIPAVSELRDVAQMCLPRMAYARAVNDDLDDVMRQYAGRTLEIGYNQPAEVAPTDPLASFRTKLVFAGNPVSVDAGALFDMGLSGVTIPQATVDVLRSCRTAVWLFPRGTEPFGLRNVYIEDVPERFPDPALFSLEFRQAFFATYRRTGSSRFFDVWTCSPGG